MRTTLDIDEDILLAARQIALQRRTTAGRVISDLVRKSLQSRPAPRMRNGVPLFRPKPGAGKAGLALVNRLRDDA